MNQDSQLISIRVTWWDSSPMPSLTYRLESSAFLSIGSTKPINNRGTGLVPPGAEAASGEANTNFPIPLERLFGRCFQAPHSKAWWDTEEHKLKEEMFTMNVGRNFFCKTAREWHRLPRKIVYVWKCSRNKTPSVLAFLFIDMQRMKIS